MPGKITRSLGQLVWTEPTTRKWTVFEAIIKLWQGVETTEDTPMDTNQDAEQDIQIHDQDFLDLLYPKAETV